MSYSFCKETKARKVKQAPLAKWSFVGLAFVSLSSFAAASDKLEVAKITFSSVNFSSNIPPKVLQSNDLKSLKDAENGKQFAECIKLSETLVNSRVPTMDFKYLGQLPESADERSISFLCGL
jgi:hypothetical protein